MLQRPAEPYAVWHFWNGPDRRFDGWYLNLQEPPTDWIPPPLPEGWDVV